jgi:predicted P-loop ATPase
MRQDIIDFRRIAELALQVHQNIIFEICPGGKLVGKEYVAASINGGDGRSFSFNTESGKWADFSAGEKGGDIISLYAKAKNIQMLQAAKEIDKKFLGGLSEKIQNYPAAPTSSSDSIIIKPPKNAPPPQLPANATRWVYRDKDGYPLFYIVRALNAETGKKFYYPQVFQSDGRWVKKHFPNPVLYRLNELLDPKNEKKWVCVVEGEKAADAAQKILGDNYIVTTWCGGVNNWKKTDWSPLSGRKVLFWADADDRDLKTNIRPGQKCMDDIYVHLMKSLILVKYIDITSSGKSGGWDAADALAEGMDFKSFAEFVKPFLITVDKRQPNAPMTLSEEKKMNAPLKTTKAELMPPEERRPQIVLNFPSPDEMPVPQNVKTMWDKAGVILDDSGKMPVNATNVAKVINSNLRGIVWRDEFYNENMTLWMNKPGEPARTWNDDDTVNMMMVCQANYGIHKCTKDHVKDAINYLACLDRRNDAVDWLNGLEWDGISRVDDFFCRAMGAANEEWSRVVSKNFWLGLAARMLKPGCQVDEMVVLESEQGTRKTSALIEIGGRWYGEANADLRNKDFDQSLRGRILVEFGELSTMKGAEIELVKRKITCREDQYRPSYGRSVGKFPRTCVFAGTTNESTYFKDVTGNRRFNPIRVGNTDMAYLRQFREQLFAEAAHRVKADEPWWLYPSDIAKEQRESRLEIDEWETTCAVYAEEQGEGAIIEIKELWRDAFNKDEADLTEIVQKRFTRIFTKLGYKRTRARIGTVLRYGFKKIEGAK